MRPSCEMWAVMEDFILLDGLQTKSFPELLNVKPEKSSIGIYNSNLLCTRAIILNTS